MAIKRCINSSDQLAVPCHVADGAEQSPYVSGVLHQGDGQPQTPADCQLNPSFGNLSNFVYGNGPASGDVNGVLNSVAELVPSSGANSSVTDANAALSGGHYMQRSVSINSDRNPSPISITSNNVGMTGSSAMDGPATTVQHNSQQDQNPWQIWESYQNQQLGASSATPQMPSHAWQVSPQVGLDPDGLLPVQKKQRTDIRHDDALQNQSTQQPMQGLDSIQLQGHNPHRQASSQQQRLLQQRRYQQQQQILQSTPQLQQAHMQRLQQQGLHPVSGVKRPYGSGMCARRLMMYFHHQRQRPKDNSILYWENLVAEYFAPNAKKRLCFSLYDTDSHTSLGVLSQATALNTWNCDICGSKPARGFENTAKALPRLHKVQFDSGVIDEHLLVDSPREFRTRSGLIMLEYQKATLESIHEQFRVVHEGRLQVIFTPDLKIFSWLFCSRRHEAFFPRRSITSQVNELVQVSHKCQSAVTDSGSAGVSPKNLQTCRDMFGTAGCELTKNLDLPNDLGFSKRYVRHLQICQVANSLKDLICFSWVRKMGPIESLEIYPREAAAAKVQIKKMQETEQLSNSQGLPADQSTINKLVATPGLGSNLEMGGEDMDTSAPTEMASSNYQNLPIQNSINMSFNAQTDASCSLNDPNQSQALSSHFPLSQVPVSLQNSTVNGLTGDHQQSHLLQQNQQQPSQENQQLEQQPSTGQSVNENTTEECNAALNGTGSLLVSRAAATVESGNKTAGTLDNAAVVTMTLCSTHSFMTVDDNSDAIWDDSWEDSDLKALLASFSQ